MLQPTPPSERRTRPGSSRRPRAPPDGVPRCRVCGADHRDRIFHVPLRFQCSIIYAFWREMSIKLLGAAAQSHTRVLYAARLNVRAYSGPQRAYDVQRFGNPERIAAGGFYSVWDTPTNMV